MMNKTLFNIAFSLALVTGICAPVIGQKFLALERYGRAKNIRIPVGSVITYQVREGQGWYTAEIIDLDYNDTLIVFPKITLPLKEIAALRYDKSWSKAVGTSLRVFGIGWSGNALIGTLTDDNPDTSYEWRDAMVTGFTFIPGFALPRIFKHRVVRLGNRKRLRIMDTRPFDR